MDRNENKNALLENISPNFFVCLYSGPIHCIVVWWAPATANHSKYVNTLNAIDAELGLVSSTLKSILDCSTLFQNVNNNKN